MEWLASLAAAVIAWLRSMGPFIQGAIASWLVQTAVREKGDADALRRVLDAPDAGGMQRDDIVAELKKRGMFNVPKVQGERKR
jgi:hypothetical protein